MPRITRIMTSTASVTAAALVWSAIAGYVAMAQTGGGSSGAGGTGAGGAAGGQPSSAGTTAGQPSTGQTNQQSPGGATRTTTGTGTQQSNADTTRPGVAQPGTTQPGTRQPGTLQPGTRPGTVPGTSPGVTPPRGATETGTVPPGASQRSDTRVDGRDLPLNDPTRRAGGTRPFDLGAQFRMAGDALVVGTVREDGFFAAAGLREGDRIISIDGRNVTSEEEFHGLLAGRQGRVRAMVLRNGEQEEITLNLDDMDMEGAAAAGTSSGGSRASAHRADGTAALGIWFYAYPQGAQVVHVMPGSPAERAGLRRGDWILRINGAPAGHWDAMVENVTHAEPDTRTDLHVVRDDNPMRMETRLAAYSDVWADSADWQTIAGRHGNVDRRGPNSSGQTYAGEGQRPQDERLPNRASQGYWTQERGTRQETGARQESGDNGSLPDRATLEQRFDRLEKEVAELKEMIRSLGATQRTNTGPRPKSQPDGE